MIFLVLIILLVQWFFLCQIYHQMVRRGLPKRILSLTNPCSILPRLSFCSSSKVEINSINNFVLKVYWGCKKISRLLVKLHIPGLKHSINWITPYPQPSLEGRCYSMSIASPILRTYYDLAKRVKSDLITILSSGAIFTKILFFECLACSFSFFFLGYIEHFSLF